MDLKIGHWERGIFLILGMKILNWKFGIWSCSWIFVHRDLSFEDLFRGFSFYEDVFMKICPLKKCSWRSVLWRFVHGDLSFFRSFFLGDLSLENLFSRFILSKFWKLKLWNFEIWNLELSKSTIWNLKIWNWKFGCGVENLRFGIENLMLRHCHCVVWSCWNLGHCMIDHIVMLALEHFWSVGSFGRGVI